MRLAGKVALVTGSGSGNGRAIALAYVREGARVLAVDVREEGVVETVAQATGLAGTISWSLADVSRASDCAQMVETAVSRYGQLDILVNNAGITGSPEASVCHTTPDMEWEQVLRVNLSGVFYGCKYALPVMLAGGSGRLINIASVAGLVAFPGRCAYTASKGGVVQLTRSLALDYAGQGIRANAICPGMIETAMTRWRLEQPELRNQIEARIPQGRVGQPEDLTGAALFLAGPESDYINGHTLVVDGGWLTH